MRRQMFIGLLLLALAIPPALAWDELAAIERERILARAEAFLSEQPQTVVHFSCERSAGGRHDFYSEGDYWWPDPANPAGPYIRRDGETNPENFVAHREAMMRLADIVGATTSAWLLTGEQRYAEHAVSHLKAWFVEPETMMNPRLEFAQAIQGRYTGRGIGIIDTLHLVEVARATELLAASPALAPYDAAAIRGWFSAYLSWLQHHPYGQAERIHPNNHGVCWSVQAAVFGQLVGDDEILTWTREQFKEVYIGMMNEQGGFTAELARTKPYGYSLFMVDAMATLAWVASTPEENLFAWRRPDGRSLALSLDFIHPYIVDKAGWPYGRDVMYWEDWPARHPALLFGGLALGRADYLNTWRALPTDSSVAEVRRNLPIRHPLLWINPDGRPRRVREN